MRPRVLVPEIEDVRSPSFSDGNHVELFESLRASVECCQPGDFQVHTTLSADVIAGVRILLTAGLLPHLGSTHDVQFNPLVIGRFHKDFQFAVFDFAFFPR